MFHHNPHKNETFVIQILYGGNRVKLQCEIIYESMQIQRIEITGRDSVLLENNYPIVKKGKAAIKWKIKKDAQYLLGKPDLFANIIRELETHIKKAST